MAMPETDPREQGPGKDVSEPVMQHWTCAVHPEIYVALDHTPGCPGRPRRALRLLRWLIARLAGCVAGRHFSHLR